MIKKFLTNMTEKRKIILWWIPLIGIIYCGISCFNINYWFKYENINIFHFYGGFFIQFFSWISFIMLIVFLIA